MRKTITFILIFIAAFCVVINAKHNRDKEKAIDEYKIAQTKMYEETSEEETKETKSDIKNATETDALSEGERALVEGVRRLQEENDDVQGYIIILDSEIPKDKLCLSAKNNDVILQYPVYQRRGNDQEALDYYLHHNGKGEKESYPGCIFGDGAVDEDGNYLFSFNDNGNHVIAGHNMSVTRNKKENWMFGGLRYYKDPEYLAEHDNLVLVTDKTVKYYRIISYYEGEADDDYYNLHPDTKDSLSRFLSEKTNMNISTSDAVTLVACDDDTSNDLNRRYIIAVSNK